MILWTDDTHLYDEQDDNDPPWISAWNLHPGDEFVIAGEGTVYVCAAQHGMHAAIDIDGHLVALDGATPVELVRWA